MTFACAAVHLHHPRLFPHRRQSNLWTDEHFITSEVFATQKLKILGSTELLNCGRYKIHALATELAAESTRPPNVKKGRRGSDLQSGRVKPEILAGSVPSEIKKLNADFLETNWSKQIGTDPTQEGFASRVSEAFKGSYSFEEAIAIWDYIKGFGLGSLEEDTFLALMRICKEHRQFHKALDLFQEMKQSGVQPGLSAYNLVLSCCQHAQGLEDALRIKDEMDEKKVGYDLDTYNSIIKLVAKYDPYRGRISSFERLQKGMALYEEMLNRSVEPDVSTYNALMLVATKAKSSDKALEIFEMLKTANVSPNIMTFEILIRLLGRSGRLKAALKAFAKLNDSGLAPNKSIYNHLIEACKNAPQPNAKKAWALYEEMKKNQSMHPDAQTFTSLVAISCKVGNFHGAMQGYQLLKDVGHSKIPSFIYNELIHAASSANGIEDAFKIYEEMKASGQKPDAATYSTLVSACIMNKDLARAQATKQELEEIGVKANQVVFHSLTSAYGLIGMWEDAVATFRRMQEQDPPTLFSYSLLFKACLGKEGVNIVLDKSIDKLLITSGIQTAIKLYKEGMSGGIFTDFVPEDISKFDLRKLTKSGIIIAMLAWLQEVQKNPPAVDLIVVSGTAKEEEATSKSSKVQLPVKVLIAQRVFELLGLSSELVNEPSSLEGLRVRHDELQHWLSSSTLPALTDELSEVLAVT